MAPDKGNNTTSNTGAQARTGSRYPFLTAKERDIETGLDYFFARYYSAIQGRFTNCGSSRNHARTSNPQSFNRYSFNRNNPVRFIDPLGMFSQDPQDPDVRKPCTVGVEPGCFSHGEDVSRLSR